jgi:hypothetical protein
MNALTKVRHLHLNSRFQVLKKLKIVMLRVITLTIFFITSKIPSLQIHQQEGYKGKGGCGGDNDSQTNDKATCKASNKTND